MTIRIQPLPFDPTTIDGLSERLLHSHHQNNYGGAVKRLAAIRSELAAAPAAGIPGFRLNGLKREELIATNSMRLHELYFASFSGAAESERAIEPATALALAASFGSVERWHDEFAAMGKALGGGSGWVLLVFEPGEARLVNQWAADHSQALAGGVPLLALDMYEHAYQIDYGAAVGDYVDAFIKLIDWAQVGRRYRIAIAAASQTFGAGHDEPSVPLVIDVRRAGAYQAAASVIAGSTWRDPAAIDTWTAELPVDRPIVVYCVHGHEVSQAAALRLRAAGVDARFLRGGIEAWQAAGLPLTSWPG